MRDLDQILDIIMSRIVFLYDKRKRQEFDGNTLFLKASWTKNKLLCFT